MFTIIIKFIKAIHMYLKLLLHKLILEVFFNCCSSCDWI